MNAVKTILVGLFFVTGLLTFTSIVDAHQSGCHRWHSCPSDTGSYVCGDLGYACQYSTYSSYSQGSYFTYFQSSYYSQGTYYVSSNSDCSSHGFAYLGECYELPENAKQSIYTGFNCDYGYEKVGYGLSAKCLPEVDNGYYIGTSLYCNYGYEKLYGRCVKESQSYSNNFDLMSLASLSSSNYSNPYSGKEFKFVYLFNQNDNKIEKKKIASSCLNEGDDVADKPYFKDGGSCYYCDPGFITDENKESCFSMTSVCESIHGKGSVPETDGICTCASGYTMQSGKCVLPQVAGVSITTNSSQNISNQLQILMKQLADLQKQVPQ